MLIMSIVLFYSCKKNDKPQAAVERVHEERTSSAVPRISNPGYSLQTTTTFFVFSDEDKGDETTVVKWGGNMTLGEKVLTGKTRKMISAFDKKPYDFIEISRDAGNGYVDGFAYAWQIAEGGQLAVVSDKNANLYKTPKIVDVTGTVLSRKTVVVYYPETQTGGFVEVRGYDFDRKDYVNKNTCHIQFNKLSVRDADIQSAILLHTANGLAADPKQKERREALLQSALEYYSDSVFYDEIFNITFPNSTSGVINNSSDDSW